MKNCVLFILFNMRTFLILTFFLSSVLCGSYLWWRRIEVSMQVTVRIEICHGSTIRRNAVLIAFPFILNGWCFFDANKCNSCRYIRVVDRVRPRTLYRTIRIGYIMNDRSRKFGFGKMKSMNQINQTHFFPMRSQNLFN